MLDPLGLLSACAAFVVVAAAPGPASLATATTAMRAGRGNALRLGAGLALGLAFWGAIAATGLGAVLEASTMALTLLKLLGGAYLLWLALGALRAARNAPAPQTSASEAPPEAALSGRWFRRGLLLNLSNPKAVLAWMATLSLGLSGGAGATQVILATLLCSLLGALIYTGYALLFSTRGMRQAYDRGRRWIELAAAGLFALAGAALLKSALSR